MTRKRMIIAAACVAVALWFIVVGAAMHNSSVAAAVRAARADEQARAAAQASRPSPVVMPSAPVAPPAAVPDPIPAPLVALSGVVQKTTVGAARTVVIFRRDGSARTFFTPGFSPGDKLFVYAVTPSAYYAMNGGAAAGVAVHDGNVVYVAVKVPPPPTPPGP